MVDMMHGLLSQELCMNNYCRGQSGEKGKGIEM